MSLYFWAQIYIVKAVTGVTVLCMPDVGMGVAHGAFFLRLQGHCQFSRWSQALLDSHTLRTMAHIGALTFDSSKIEGEVHRIFNGWCT